MTELIFNTAKDYSLMNETTSQNWTITYENIEKKSGYFESTIQTDENGFFSEESPKIIITFKDGKERNIGFCGAVPRSAPPDFDTSLNSDFYWRTNVAIRFFKNENDDIGGDFYTFIPASVYDYTFDNIIQTSKFHLSTGNKTFISGIDARHIKKIVIEFLSTANKNYVSRINDFIFRFFEETEGNIVSKINKFKDIIIKEQIDVLSADLPLNSCECVIVSNEEIYLKRNVEFDIEKDGEYFGRFYIVDFKKVADNLYSISSNGILGKLDSNTFEDFPLIKPREFVTTQIESDELVGGVFFKEPNQLVSCERQYPTVYLNGFFPIDSYRKLLCQTGWALNRIVDGSRRSFALLRLFPTYNGNISQINNKKRNKRIIGEITVSDESYTAGNFVTYEHQYAFWDGGYIDTTNEKELFSAKGKYGRETKFIYPDAPKQVSRISVVDEDGNRTRDLTIIKTTPNYVIFKDNNSSSNVNIKFFGFDCGVSTSDNFIENRFTIETLPNVKKYDKYTIYPVETDGVDLRYEPTELSIKKYNIQKIIESEGVINAKIVLNGEKVGDLVSFDAGSFGECHAIITSLQYKPLNQMIANATLLITSIGFSPLYDKNGEEIYDKFGLNISVLER